MRISQDELKYFMGKKVLVEFLDKGNTIKYIGYIKSYDNNIITLFSANFGISEIIINSIKKIRVLRDE